MILDSKHISYLEGCYNGYAVFAMGKGRDQKFGLIDREGAIVVKPEFPISLRTDKSRYVRFFNKRSNSFRYARYYDLIKGIFVNIDEKYNPIPIAGSDGRYFRTFTRNRAGIADYTGRQILPMKYGFIGWCGGNFIVQDPNTQLFGIMTPDGDVVVPFSREYNCVYPGDIGMPVLVKEDKRWFYIDKYGEAITSKGEPELPVEEKLMYLECKKRYTIYGVSRRTAVKFGMLGESGQEVIPPIYDNIYLFNQKYVCTRIYEPYKAGLKDLYGNTVIPTDGNRSLYSISGDDDLIIVQYENDKFHDSSETCIVRIEADGALTEVASLKYCICSNQSDLITAASWRVYRGKRKLGKYGLLSSSGEVLVPFEYDRIIYWDDKERIAVNKGNEWFFINSKNERTLF